MREIDERDLQHGMADTQDIAVMRNKICIDFERKFNAFWHADCNMSRHGGAMKLLKNECERSLVECTCCGKKGYYPVGGIGKIEVNELDA